MHAPMMSETFLSYTDANHVEVLDFAVVKVVLLGEDLLTAL